MRDKKYSAPGILMLLALIMYPASRIAVAGEVVFASPPTRVHLIELYTSEGCSSCPPADRWLSSFKDQPGLFTEFVPVAFHVDYWDKQGWKDPLGDARYTWRQKQYSRAWMTRSVYTPNFVLDGRDWEDWVQEKLPPASEEPTGVLKARPLPGGKVEIEFTIDGLTPEGGWRAHVALLGTGIESKVTAGENDGRTLRHDFSAVSYATDNLKRGKDRDNFIAVLRLPRRARVATERLALAAWVSADADPTPMQAVGGFLPSENPVESKR